MKSGSKILVMSKYIFQLGHKKNFTRLKKINDFSFIDLMMISIWIIYWQK